MMSKVEMQLERPDEDHQFFECKHCGLTFPLDAKEEALWHVQITHEKSDWVE